MANNKIVFKWESPDPSHPVWVEVVKKPNLTFFISTSRGDMHLHKGGQRDLMVAHELAKGIVRAFEQQHQLCLKRII